MRKLTQGIGLVVLVIAGLAAPMFTILARAGVDLVDKPGNAKFGLVTATVDGGQQCPFPAGTLVQVAPPCPQQKTYLCAGVVFPNRVFLVYGVDAACNFYCIKYCAGDGKGGTGLGTSGLPDSMYALVGLYTPPGGTAMLPPPAGTGSLDSTMHFSVTRGATQVTLNFGDIIVGGVHVGAGGLQARSVTSHMRSLASYTVIVYPDSFAANADLARTGTGSAFYGKVILKGGPDQEIGGPVFQVRTLPGKPGFSESDWILQPTNAGQFGKWTLRPIANLSKVVNVSNGNQATIVTVPHTALEDSVPATSPIGLILLTLALMGSGFWAVMRSRQKSVAA